MSANAKELKNTTYEAFIGILSVLSIVNILLIYAARSEVVDDVVLIMSALLSVIFFADFVYRLITAENRGRYFFREFGWADLLASLPLPQFKILRVFRILRAYRLCREYGIGPMLKTFWAERAQSALLVVVLLIMMLLEFGSMAMVFFEEDAAGANIDTGGGAVWWAFVTITTVGYGDKFPVTAGGRITGVLVMAGGVALFGTLTGYLANLFLAPSEGEPTTAVPGSAKAMIAATRRELEEQEKVTSRLRVRLAEIEQLL
jgi:voltage-gated potassium channel